MSALHELASAAGIQVDWIDADGNSQRVKDEVLVAILEALGLPASSEGQIVSSAAQLREDEKADTGRGLEMKADEPARSLGERRIWGAAVQISSLRDGRCGPFGDFGSLARFAAAAARAGADAVAISPVHALFPADPESFSPYGPSTRLFLNVLLADPELLGGGAMPKRESGGLIDWQAAIPERMRLLRNLYDGRDDVVREAVQRFARTKGEALQRHATFDVLFERFGSGWQDWPSGFRDPDGPAVRRFAGEHAEEVGFYLFLQWLADRSLARAQEEARAGGMSIGLIADMAVGMSHGGSEAWSRRDELLSGLSVGAPPDAFNSEGQDWGITTFSPLGLRRSGYRGFIETIRAALEHSGGIRIDHAMSLKRLWVVPHGASPREGAYLSYPQEEMTGILAREAGRSGALVVGEDLGTVPPGFRSSMRERGFLGMRVLWFERNGDGGFRSPSAYEPLSAAMTSTHDLPTVAGWLSGRDIDWNAKLGRLAGADETDARARRETEKAMLLSAFEEASIDTSDPVGAALEYVASAKSGLALFPVEDLLGLDEQPNLPGTIDEHPNWRRRLPVESETLFEGIADRIGRIEGARGRR